MKHLESGCGSVGTAVDSDPRDPGSKPVICKFYLLSNVMKRQQLGKRGREWTKLETNLAFYTLSIALPIQIKRNYDKKLSEVVVAQLVKRLLPIPEVRGSNPVIVKIYVDH